MENTRVKTKSGLEGWQGRLQDQYDDLESFCYYDEMYRLAAKLGFSCPREVWEANPLVQGSTNPDDYCRVYVEVDEDDYYVAEAAKVKEREEGEQILKDSKLEREIQ